ncbi:MAG: SCO1664 family protein [Anaerolineae bacterium]
MPRAATPVPEGTSPPPAEAQHLEALGRGTIRLGGRLPWSSNATFLVLVGEGVDSLPAVYKPARGERPLWDFPSGSLHRREEAAFIVSEAVGWHLVPATVVREGPLGSGAIQRFVPHDPELHYLAMDSPPAAVVARIAAFDIVVNNADRKSGHVLADETGRLWCIDHGLTFHVEPKLRTVIWEQAGQPIAHDVAADLGRLQEALAAGSALDNRLAAILSPREMAALRARLAALVSAGRFPAASAHRREVPWPPV